MPFVITDPCIGTKDSACVDVCPVDCIHPRKDEPEFAAGDDALHSPGRVHRLRRLRARVSGGCHLRQPGLDAGVAEGARSRPTRCIAPATPAAVAKAEEMAQGACRGTSRLDGGAACRAGGSSRQVRSLQRYCDGNSDAPFITARPEDAPYRHGGSREPARRKWLEAGKVRRSRRSRMLPLKAAEAPHRYPTRRSGSVPNARR